MVINLAPKRNPRKHYGPLFRWVSPGECSRFKAWLFCSWGVGFRLFGFEVN